jgi:hypothetical protein
MNDNQLADSMRALPRTKASPSFTSDVLRAVRRESAPKQARVTWRTAAAFAMVACLMILVHATFLRYSREQQLDAIRAEQARIEAELAAVKRNAVTSDPVVVLENEDGTRVLVELTDGDNTAPTPTKVIY